MIKRFVPIIFTVFFNLWIWKVLSFNILIGLVVITSSIFLWLLFQENKKIFFTVSVGLYLILLLMQFKTSAITPLTYLTEHEKINQIVKMRGYPPVFFTLAGKTVWIPASNWLEKRNEIIIFYKLQKNVSEVLDPNLYFFANHPRERVGVVEFEKFPYVLLPAFFLGFVSLKRKQIKGVLMGLSPLILISLIGNSNPAGPFALFPFIAVLISSGLLPVFARKKYLIVFSIIFLFIFIQTISYEIY